MYSRLPAFVFGFHGCDQAIKEAVLSGGEPLKPSTNNYDWLGSGIYFWEQNPVRAMDFAALAMQHPGRYTSRPITTPAVLGAVIDLGNCMNLMDAAHLERLKYAYDYLETNVREAGTQMPTNHGRGPDRPLRELDRAVIETLCAYTEMHGIDPKYDTVRGLFMEGEPVYPGAGFRAQAHIQICVRNINCIKALFDPREKKEHPYITSTGFLP